MEGRLACPSQEEGTPGGGRGKHHWYLWLPVTRGLLGVGWGQWGEYGLMCLECEIGGGVGASQPRMTWNFECAWLAIPPLNSPISCQAPFQPAEGPACHLSPLFSELGEGKASEAGNSCRRCAPGFSFPPSPPRRGASHGGIGPGRTLRCCVGGRVPWRFSSSGLFGASPLTLYGLAG